MLSVASTGQCSVLELMTLWLFSQTHPGNEGPWSGPCYWLGICKSRLLEAWVIILHGCCLNIVIPLVTVLTYWQDAQLRVVRVSVWRVRHQQLSWRKEDQVSSKKWRGKKRVQVAAKCLMADGENRRRTAKVGTLRRSWRGLQLIRNEPSGEVCPVATEPSPTVPGNNANAVSLLTRN